MMRDGLKHIISLLFLFGLFWCPLAAAEPLRILVPDFFGPEPVSQHVRTTVYLEMIKAFRSTDAPEKGGWILYDREPLEEPSHRAVVAAASWPSVSADLALWGEVQEYAEGAAVQLYLSLSPLLKKRQVRPEFWQVKLKGRNGPVRAGIDLPEPFFEFEPLLIDKETIVRFKNPEGMIIYSSRTGGQPIGRLAEVMRFYEIHNDAIKIATAGRKGWLRIPPLSTRQSEAIDFSKGMVRLLRGDWAGARRSFKAVLEVENLPQHLRIHTLIYIGLAKEKAGISGRQDFEQAYLLNRLDQTAAAYLLMSRLADIARLQERADAEPLAEGITRFRKDLKETKILFSPDDPWFKNLESSVR
jgi:hypothetical protein